MKKILIITFEYPPQIGGIATYVHDLAEALSEDKVIVLASTSSNLKEQKKWDKRQKYVILRKKLLFPLFIWPRWLSMYLSVRKIIRQEGIELLMIHHILPVGYIGILCRKLAGVKFIIFSHGTDTQMAVRNLWKKLMCSWICKNSSLVVFNSDSLKRRFTEHFPICKQKSKVLYPCPERNFLQKPKHDVIDGLKKQYALIGKQVILSVGRLDEGKGFSHFIRALPKILKNSPHIVWMIVGDGPKRDGIIEDIQKNNLQNVVRFIGEVAHGEIKKFYYLADLFVLLTHPNEGREEGLGLVFLEAAAAGLPVVAGRSGGVEEAVLHGQTGVIIDTRDQSTIVKTVSCLLKNRDYARKLGMAGRQRIEQEFMWDEKLKQLDDWIK